MRAILLVLAAVALVVLLVVSVDTLREGGEDSDGDRAQPGRSAARARGEQRPGLQGQPADTASSAEGSPRSSADGVGSEGDTGPSAEALRQAARDLMEREMAADAAELDEAALETDAGSWVPPDAAAVRGGAHLPGAPTGQDDGLHIRGRVINARGDPVARVLVEAAGLYDYSSEEGTFTHTFDKPGTYEIKARLSGLFAGTASQRISVAARGESQEVILRFHEENTVHGQARLPDGKPAAGVLIKITTTSNEMGLGFIAEMIWSSTYARSWLASRTDADGHFGFAGVDPRSRYRLWYMSDGGVARQLPGEVRAGRLDVAVEVQRHRVRVETIDAATGANVDAWLHLSDPGTERRVQNPQALDKPLNAGGDWDEQHHVAPPGTPVRIVAFRPGYLISDTQYVMTSAWGEQRVKVLMRPVRGTPVLRVGCEGPKGEPLENAPVDIFYVSPRSRSEVKLPIRVGSVGGVPQTDGLASMRIRVAKGDWSSLVPKSYFAFLQPASTTIDLPPSGVTWARLDLEPGGMFRLLFEADPGLAAGRGGDELTYELRNEQGRRVDVRWTSTYSGKPDLTRLVRYGPHISSSLPPGMYELSLGSSREVGLEPQTLRFEVVAGQTMDVITQLVFDPK